MWFAGTARRVPAAGRPRVLRLGFHLARGMRVGLFGGSFNPAHEGHAHVAETALRRLDLDRVIWLVSPQNPLKPPHETAALTRRIYGTHRYAQGPSMIVSDAETRIGSLYTIDTLQGAEGALSGRLLRLDHGRRQPGDVPPLARLDADHARDAGRGDRAARTRDPQPLLAGGAAVRVRTHTVVRGQHFGLPRSRPPGSTCARR